MPLQYNILYCFQITTNPIYTNKIFISKCYLLYKNYCEIIHLKKNFSSI